MGPVEYKAIIDMQAKRIQALLASIEFRDEMLRGAIQRAELAEGELEKIEQKRRVRYEFELRRRERRSRAAELSQVPSMAGSEGAAVQQDASVVRDGDGTADGV